MALNRCGNKGFSLVELMVVMAILGVVMIGVLGLITTQNKVYHSEESILDMQMNGRLAADYISRFVRIAGFGCAANISATNDVNGFGNVFNTLDGGGSAADSLTVVTALVPVGIVDDRDSDHKETFESVSAIPVKVLDSSYTLASFFNNSTKKYLFLAPGEEEGFLTISAPVDSDDATITIDKSIRVAEGVEVYPVKAYTFSLSSGALILNNNTGSGNQEVAEDIENLQFQYGWDINGDGRFDPLDSGDWVNDPSGNEAKIKAVRIFILSRSANLDREYTDRKTYRINETAGADAAIDVGPFNDHYHRFLLQTMVIVRNFSL